MQEPKLCLFDPEKLVDKLNSSLSEGLGTVELGEFVPKVPRKKLFPGIYGHRQVEIGGKFPILQSENSDLELKHSGDRVGYIFVEKGHANSWGDDGVLYEGLRLRTRLQLESREGVIVPVCNVDMSIEMQEYGEPCFLRSDHKRFLGCSWIRTDLTEALPTEWFFRKRT